MHKRLVLTMIVPVALAACSEHSVFGARTVAHTSPVAAASPTPVTSSPIVLTTKLTPESGSKVTGTATVTTAGASFTIRLEAAGLRAASTHPAHIHAGTCGSNGPIVFPLEHMVANGAGDAVASTWIHHPYQVPASGWYVEIHQVPPSSGAGETPIACAKLPAAH